MMSPPVKENKIGEPLWMRTLRSRADEEYRSVLWPDTSMEEWRRSDVSELNLDSYRPLSLPAGAYPRLEAGKFLSGEELGGVIRFRGSRCTEAFLDEELKGRGVHFMTLDDAIPIFERQLEGPFSRLLEEADNRFQLWHMSRLSHGVFLWVPEFAEIRRPFLIDMTEETPEGSDGQAYPLSSPHVVIILESGARATLIQRIGGTARRILVNAGLEIRMGNASRLAYSELQSLDDTALFFNHGKGEVGRDAQLEYFKADLGAFFVKDTFDCRLEGRGADVDLNGVFFAGDKRHVDLRTVQRHRAPNGRSRALFKGAVKDSAWSIYQGLIEVGEKAGKTDAYLTNKNLILNDGARADSIPSLQINTDDVRCSHGSTTGKIDEEALFYLTSRGIPPDEAEALIVEGFFEDLISKQQPVLRKELTHQILRRLKRRTGSGEQPMEGGGL
jgi:Fe-S cluster assembly protein SufD